MNYLALKKSVKRIKFKSKIKNLFSSFVDFVSYGLAIFALFQSCFFQNNQFSFNPTSPWSYAVSVICILLFCFGIKNIYDKIKESSEIIVNKSELHDLINFARHNATESVINFAGDLSWLKNETADIEQIKREHNGIMFTLYYDKKRTSNEDKKLIRSLHNKGIINAVGYPYDDIVKLRCMFIDLHSNNELRDSSKAYVYQRCDNNADKFIWHEYSSKDKVFANSVESIVGLLSLVKKPTFRVGFSGINNVGKTALAEKCETILSANHKVKLYGDAFYSYSKKTNYDNMCVLCQQLSNESIENEIINLYDRTVYDNYRYSYLRAGRTNNTNLHRLDPLINDSMTKYDIIYYVKRKNEKFDFDTTHVTRADRQSLNREFEHYYSNKQGLNVKTVYVDFGDIENSLCTLSKEISDEILKLYERKCAKIK